MLFQYCRENSFPRQPGKGSRGLIAVARRLVFYPVGSSRPPQRQPGSPGWDRDGGGGTIVDNGRGGGPDREPEKEAESHPVFAREK